MTIPFSIRKYIEVVVIDGREHHVWHGSSNSRGYPQVRQGGGYAQVNRLMWEDTFGDLDSRDRLTKSDECDIRRCVRPSHWEIM